MALENAQKEEGKGFNCKKKETTNKKKTSLQSFTI